MLLKGFTKLYLTDYLCAVITVFNTALYNSAFSAYIVKYQVIRVFVLTYFENEILRHKHLSTAFHKKKHASRELLSF